MGGWGPLPVKRNGTSRPNRSRGSALLLRSCDGLHTRAKMRVTRSPPPSHLCKLNSGDPAIMAHPLPPGHRVAAYGPLAGGSVPRSTPCEAPRPSPLCLLPSDPPPRAARAILFPPERRGEEKSLANPGQHFLQRTYKTNSGNSRGKASDQISCVFFLTHLLHESVIH